MPNYGSFSIMRILKVYITFIILNLLFMLTLKNYFVVTNLRYSNFLKVKNILLYQSTSVLSLSNCQVKQSGQNFALRIGMITVASTEIRVDNFNCLLFISFPFYAHANYKKNSLKVFKCHFSW